MEEFGRSCPRESRPRHRIAGPHVLAAVLSPSFKRMRRANDRRCKALIYIQVFGSVSWIFRGSNRSKAHPSRRIGIITAAASLISSFASSTGAERNAPPHKPRMHNFRADLLSRSRNAHAPRSLTDWTCAQSNTQKPLMGCRPDRWLPAIFFWEAHTPEICKQHCSSD